jgi:hypothetical protein
MQLQWVTIAMGEVEKWQPRLKLYPNAVVVSSISQHLCWACPNWNRVTWEEFIFSPYADAISLIPCVQCGHSQCTTLVLFTICLCEQSLTKRTQPKVWSHLLYCNSSSTKLAGNIEGLLALTSWIAPWWICLRGTICWSQWEM